MHYFTTNLYPTKNEIKNILLLFKLDIRIHIKNILNQTENIIKCLYSLKKTNSKINYTKYLKELLNIIKKDNYIIVKNNYYTYSIYIGKNLNYAIPLMTISKTRGKNIDKYYFDLDYICVFVRYDEYKLYVIYDNNYKLYQIRNYI